MYRILLEILAKFRIPLSFTFVRQGLAVGELSALDALGSTRWKEFVSAEKLFDTWAPAVSSRWEAFHCPTLFASIDYLDKKEVGCAPDAYYHEFAGGWTASSVPAPRWLDQQTWLILDAPGWISVAVAAQLAQYRVCETVCTFDNWPHPKGLIQPEMTIAALLRYAPMMETVRRNLVFGLPPVWVCDNTRLGNQPGSPGQFDNRYFLDDSILPGPELLKTNGIQRVVYASPGLSSPPTADLTDYFNYLIQQGLPLLRVGMSSVEAWKAEPVPVHQIPKLPLNRGSFFRATAGGFGSEIPEPSSSSG